MRPWGPPCQHHLQRSQSRDPCGRIAHAFSEQLTSLRRFGQSSHGWHACQLYRITSSKTPNQAIAKQHTPTFRNAVDSPGKLMKLLNFPPRADRFPSDTPEEYTKAVAASSAPTPDLDRTLSTGRFRGIRDRLLPPAAASALQHTPCRPLSTILHRRLRRRAEIGLN